MSYLHLDDGDSDRLPWDDEHGTHDNDPRTIPHTMRTFIIHTPAEVQLFSPEVHHLYCFTPEVHPSYLSPVLHEMLAGSRKETSDTQDKRIPLSDSMKLSLIHI